MAALGRRSIAALFVAVTCVQGCRSASAAGPYSQAGAASVPAPRATRAVPPRPNARWTGVPRIDAATRDRLVAIAALGAQRGMRRDVFAKLGDSITESASFLQDLGHGWYDLGRFSSLSATIEQFHRTTVDRDGNDSFMRPSQAASMGWTTADALEGPAPDAIERELDLLHPSIAFVMFGTNDVDRGSESSFRDGLGRIVADCLRRGVIPVLSTIPDRLDDRSAGARVPAFNNVIRTLARDNGTPLIDLHTALETLPNRGLDPDGIHPSAWQLDGDTRTASFDSDALRYGYNVRNLTTLQTLDLLRRVVFDHEAPDP
jgi:hypothetical protein